MIKTKFWTKNRRNCLLSAVIPAFIFTTLLHVAITFGKRENFLSVLLFLSAALYIIYPALALKYFSHKFKIVRINSETTIGDQTLQRGAYLELAGCLYIKSALKKIISFCVLIIFASICIGFILLNTLNPGILRSFMFVMPYLTYHVFCFIKNEPLAMIRALSFIEFQNNGPNSWDWNKNSCMSITPHRHKFHRSNLSGPYNVGGHTSMYGHYISNGKH